MGNLWLILVLPPIGGTSGLVGSTLGECENAQLYRPQEWYQCEFHQNHMF